MNIYIPVIDHCAQCIPLCKEKHRTKSDNAQYTGGAGNIQPHPNRIPPTTLHVGVTAPQPLGLVPLATRPPRPAEPLRDAPQTTAHVQCSLYRTRIARRFVWGFRFSEAGYIGLSNFPVFSNRWISFHSDHIRALWTQYA